MKNGSGFCFTLPFSQIYVDAVKIILAKIPAFDRNAVQSPGKIFNKIVPTDRSYLELLGRSKIITVR